LSRLRDLPISNSIEINMSYQVEKYLLIINDINYSEFSIDELNSIMKKCERKKKEIEEKKKGLKEREKLREFRNKFFSDKRKLYTDKNKKELYEEAKKYLKMGFPCGMPLSKMKKDRLEEYIVWFLMYKEDKDLYEKVYKVSDDPFDTY